MTLLLLLWFLVDIEFPCCISNRRESAWSSLALNGICSQSPKLVNWNNYTGITTKRGVNLAGDILHDLLKRKQDSVAEWGMECICSPIIASERVTEPALTSPVSAEVAVDWIFLFLAAVGIFLLRVIEVMEMMPLILWHASTRERGAISQPTVQCCHLESKRTSKNEIQTRLGSRIKKHTSLYRWGSIYLCGWNTEIYRNGLHF